MFHVISEFVNEMRKSKHGLAKAKSVMNVWICGQGMSSEWHLDWKKTLDTLRILLYPMNSSGPVDSWVGKYCWSACIVMVSG